MATSLLMPRLQARISDGPGRGRGFGVFAWLTSLAAILWGGTGCATQGLAPTEPALPRSTSYLKAEGPAGGERALRIACRRLTSPRFPGQTLWLAGASHIGSPEYYRELQQLLDAQGVVLFEGVRATEHSNGSGGMEDKEALENSLQGAIAGSLGLVFQLVAVDYSRAHFRNSDLSIPELQRLVQKSLASPRADESDQEAGVQFSVLMQALDGQSWLNGVARVLLGFIHAAPKLQALAKMTLIEVMGRVAGDLDSLAGGNPAMKKLLAILVDARNQRVVEDLRRVLEHREGTRGVAIFYGAAHMTDFEARLERQLGFRPREERWLTAFAVDPHGAGLGPEEERMVKSLVDWQMEALGQKPAK
ncbi:MAG TPA: hypothetical protein DCM86_04585 [Verrucomicrobiales bacterium]|nr:hypothetical protein [Verrucomicrobiales bacterium]